MNTMRIARFVGNGSGALAIMSGVQRPNLELAWFEGLVVSFGALSGIVSMPRMPSPTALPRLFVVSTPLASFFWLVAFALAGWIGWRLQTLKPRGPAVLTWGLMLLCLFAWRPLFFAVGAVWPGAVLLSLASVLTALLLPLSAAIDLAVSWACLPLLVWIGYSAVAILYLALLT